MGYVPILPSELVINEKASREYKDWLALDRGPIAVVVGRPGIGKETSIRLINKIHNYSEEYIDGLYTREKLLEIIKSIESIQRVKTIKGREKLFIFRDIDKSLLKRVLNIRTSAKVVLISDEPLKIFSENSCSVIKCYSDAYKVYKRVENLCKKRSVTFPEEISKRIRNGEKIGKSLSDIEIYSKTERIKGHTQVSTGSLSYIEILDRILHRRNEPRRTYEEIERICENNGGQNVQDLLFTNYLEKAISLEDLSYLSEITSFYNSSTRYEINSIPAYIYHTMLYNSIFISFKVPARKVVHKRTGILYNNYPINYLQLNDLKGLVSVLVRKVKKQRVPSELDEYSKSTIRNILSGVERSLSSFEESDIEVLKSVDREVVSQSKADIPRYIYKDGHSNYVTRDITLDEILY